jgi:hypothetical protein
MGQYWKVVNFSKREYILPWTLGAGLKLNEQLAEHPGTGAALLVLCAAMPEPRGGGDFDIKQNWHGLNRQMSQEGISGPTPPGYAEVARRTIGRWAGDRIALVGDDALRSAMPPEYNADVVYFLCNSVRGVQEKIQQLLNHAHEIVTLSSDQYEVCKSKADTREELFRQAKLLDGELELRGPFMDVSADVAKVIEHELQGRFTGDGWRQWSSLVPVPVEGRA